MSAFAAAAKAAEPEQTTSTVLVSRFLSDMSATSGEYHAAGGNLYHKKKVIARRTPQGVVLLPEQNLPDVSMNDALIAGIVASGHGLRRVKGFETLSNPADRIAELDGGKLDEFKTVASLFKFNYTHEELAAIKVAQDFRSRVKDFFTKVEKEETDRVKTAEERALAERIATAALGWDRGEGQARNRSVSGEGGGQRIRLSKTPRRVGTRTSPAIETSEGQRTTLAQVERAWRTCAKVWTDANKDLADERYSALIRSTISGGREVRVYAQRVEFGCQTIKRKEAERFATLMGWKQ